LTFKPGVSGNPAGKPKGPHKVAKELHRIISAASPGLTRSILADAKKGDSLSRSLFARHFLPKTRINLEPLPETPLVTNAEEAAARLAEISAKVASGELDFEAAAAITAPLQAYIGAINVATLEAKFEAALEQIERLQATVDQLVAAKTAGS
jgi:hypothetical protein